MKAAKQRRVFFAKGKRWRSIVDERGTFFCFNKEHSWAIETGIKSREIYVGFFINGTLACERFDDNSWKREESHEWQKELEDQNKRSISSCLRIIGGNAPSQTQAKLARSSQNMKWWEDEKQWKSWDWTYTHKSSFFENWRWRLCFRFTIYDAEKQSLLYLNTTESINFLLGSREYQFPMPNRNLRDKSSCDKRWAGQKTNYIAPSASQSGSL